LRTTNWKDIAELVGIAAIVASLVFVGMQMKQSQQLALAESAQIMRANGIELASLQTQHIDVWIRGNSGEKLEGEDLEIYRILFTQVQNQWFFNWLALDSIGTDFESIAPGSFARYLQQNPGAEAEWTLRTGPADTSPVSVNSAGAFPAFVSEVQAELDRLKNSAGQR